MYFQDIQNVTPAQARQGILETDHGQEGAMDKVKEFFNNLLHFSI